MTKKHEEKPFQNATSRELARGEEKEFGLRRALPAAEEKKGRRWRPQWRSQSQPAGANSGSRDHSGLACPANRDTLKYSEVRSIEFMLSGSHSYSFRK